LEGDIIDQAAFERAVVDNGITHIIHLAGLQVPFVRADPVQGARVNVVGTTLDTIGRGRTTNDRALPRRSRSRAHRCRARNCLIPNER